MENKNGLKSAQEWFFNAGLPFPYIPQKFLSAFHLIAPHVYSSRPDLPMSPYAIDTYIQEAKSNHVAEYVLLGHAGHGTNSWAMHYYLVYKNLGLFIQAPLGGVYDDEKKDIANMKQLFTEAEKTIRNEEQAPDKVGPRIIIAQKGWLL